MGSYFTFTSYSVRFNHLSSVSISYHMVEMHAGCRHTTPSYVPANHSAQLTSASEVHYRNPLGSSIRSVNNRQVTDAYLTPFKVFKPAGSSTEIPKTFAFHSNKIYSVVGHYIIQGLSRFAQVTDYYGTLLWMKLNARSRTIEIYAQV